MLRKLEDYIYMYRVVHEYRVPTARQWEVPRQLRKLEDYVYIYTAVALVRCRIELKKYTVCTAVLQGRGSCRRASGPRHRVAGMKSSLALAGLLHVGIYTGMLPAEKRERWHEGLGGTNEWE